MRTKMKTGIFSVALLLCLVTSTARAEEYIDQGAQQQVMQNQQQILQNGAQGLTSSEGQQFINQGQATGVTATTMQQSQQAPYQPPVRTATGGGSAGSAKGAQMSQLIAVGGGIAAAAYLKPQCMPPTGTPNAAACAMMALSLGQSAMSLASSGKSANSAGQFSTGAGPGNFDTGGPGGPNNPYGPGTGDVNNPGGDPNGPNGPNTRTLAVDQELGKMVGEYNALKSDLDRAGYKVSPDGATITGPNGKQIPSSAFSSPEAMKAAGFSDAQIEAMMNAQKAAAAKAKDKIRGIAMAVEGGAGGGMANPSGGGGSGGGGGGYGGFNMRMPTQKAEKPGVSGLSKQLGNDKIGIASDNIFEMIHIRYLERDKVGNFQKQ